MQTNPINTAATRTDALSDVDVTKDKASAAALSQDFETFLQMLTVQLENQDPLNPVEASDYAVQLATFSGVEQQVKTNELLADLAEQFTLQNLGQYANWIGHDIRHTGPTFFDGNPIHGVAKLKDAADMGQLVIRDATDREVQRITLSDSGDFNWSGLDDQGAALPSGRYTITVESFGNGRSLGEDPTEIYATVSETRLSDGNAVLVMSDGSEIGPQSVSALR